MNAVPVMWWRQNCWPIIQFLWALPIYTQGADHFEQGASDACTGIVYNQQFRNISFLVDT